ncbi:hypothetical protein PanWU01x14_036360 [Parasponia andersonii]|uniref:Transmembrane protein n=1 Tax=Parasponia andersonii TaxID=3476 RepID=A0A2P5DSG4_PARAD|nr:hypothetical protein PanWU01x14_036360 [Parasponia andersonii]
MVIYWNGSNPNRLKKKEKRICTEVKGTSDAEGKNSNFSSSFTFSFLVIYTYICTSILLLDHRNLLGIILSIFLHIVNKKGNKQLLNPWTLIFALLIYFLLISAFDSFLSS